MRFTPFACGAAAILSLVSSAGFAEKPAPVVIKPLAVEMVRDAQTLAKAGDRNGATDLLETALAVDPRAADAFIALAQLARDDGMSGKAIGYYAEALALNPNDKRALSGQGLVLLERGAKQKATDNLAKLGTLCRFGCAELSMLKRAIRKDQTAQAQPVDAIKPLPYETEPAPVPAPAPAPAPAPKQP